MQLLKANYDCGRTEENIVMFLIETYYATVRNILCNSHN